MKKSLDVLYLSLHHHLKKKYGYKPISKKDFYALLGRHFLIPKNLRVVVLEEMKGRKLIELIDKQNIRIMGAVVDIEDSSKFYQEMGFF